MVTGAERTARRALRLQRINARVEWFGDQVEAGIITGMSRRVAFAAQWLRDKIVFNISIPVDRARGRVVGRSFSGEYPRTETTRLMKDIFFQRVATLRYQVGTTLDYGLILETRMNRSFLLRTLNESRDMIRRILVRGTGVGGDHVIFDDGPIG